MAPVCLSCALRAGALHELSVTVSPIQELITFSKSMTVTSPYRVPSWSFCYSSEPVGHPHVADPFIGLGSSLDVIDFDMLLA
jgi:hypothetical protein